MLARNTNWTQQFLMDWIKYANDFLAKFNADNAPLHMHLLRTLMPNASHAIRQVRRVFLVFKRTCVCCTNVQTMQ